MTETTLNHPGDEALRELSLGQLTEAELASISTHLGECPACCRRLDQLTVVDHLLGRLQQMAASQETVLVSPALRRAAVRALRYSEDSRSAARKPDPQAVPLIRPAARLVGDYEILSEVGRGGMGVVYKARHRSLRRLTALKMVLAGEFASPAQELRFRLEAELAARVLHPNIVQVYEVGSFEGRPFLALEWVEGGNLASRLDGKPWPPHEAAALIETLAHAINVAHCEGVVHRDLKPANILLAVERGARTVQGGEWRAQGEGSGTEVERRKSGQKGEGDGAPERQGTGSLAVGNRPGGGVLSGDQGHSEGGTVRDEQSDPARRGLDPCEHRGRPGPGVYQEIPPAPECREGFTHGTGDTPDAQSARWLARSGHGDIPSGPDRAHQPDALRTSQSVGKAPLTSQHPAPPLHPAPSTLHPKITDFGLAQTIERGQTMTQSGLLVGTPGYMAPEQAGGKRALVGPATDIYALGVVLYQLLTGQLPFQSESTHELLKAVTTDEPTRPRRLQPRVPRDLEAITLHCLEKDPRRRYPSALALAEDLQRFREGKQVHARPVGAAARLTRACRRRPLVALLLVLLTISLFGGLGGVTWNWLKANEQRDLANAHARQANAEKQAALYQAYRASLAAASAALQYNDVADAARHLESAPEALRGWEWRHLHSRLDDSSSVVPLAAGGDGLLFGAPERLRVGVLTGAGLRLTDLERGDHTTLPLDPNHRRHVSVTQTRRGLRVTAWVSNTAFDVLDEAGQVLCRVEVPGDKGYEPADVVVSLDGTWLACRTDTDWNRVAVFDATSGKQAFICNWPHWRHPDGDL